MPSNHFILCCPLLLLPSIFPSIRVFSNVSALHIRWQKYWSFSLSISPSNEHPGLISFRMDWLTSVALDKSPGSAPIYRALTSGTAVHRVAKSQTRLSDFTFTFHFHALEKEMATHSRVLAWRISGTGEPGGLPSMGSHRVGHD